MSRDAAARLVVNTLKVGVRVDTFPLGETLQSRRLESADASRLCISRRVREDCAVIYPGGALGRSAFLGLAAGAAWWCWRHWRSAAVAAWDPSTGTTVRAGPLRVRVLGSGGPVVLLLHGMVAAGNSFGAAYDTLAEHATVVVPDLLGFGGSMVTTGRTDASAHIAALDAALDGLRLQRRPTIVAGHSMGGVLALRWAAEHPDRVRAVVTFGAPLYLNRTESNEHIAGIGRMEALFAGDGPLPRAACSWMCRHRTAASWIAVGFRPDFPVPVARSGVKHTWSTYSGSFDGLIRDSGWYDALRVLGRAGIPVTLTVGGRDPVPVQGRAEEFARIWPQISCLTHPGSGHMLPLTDPHWCRRLLTEPLMKASLGAAPSAVSS